MRCLVSAGVGARSEALARDFCRASHAIGFAQGFEARCPGWWVVQSTRAEFRFAHCALWDFGASVTQAPPTWTKPCGATTPSMTAAPPISTPSVASWTSFGQRGCGLQETSLDTYDT